MFLSLAFATLDAARLALSTRVSDLRTAACEDQGAGSLSEQL